MLQNVCIADQQKKKKKKKKNKVGTIAYSSSVYNPTLHIKREKVFKVGLYVYAIICTLFPFFSVLLSLDLITFSVFSSLHTLVFNDIMLQEANSILLATTIHY